VVRRWVSVPPAARPIADAADDAVGAAQARTGDEFDAAVARLSSHDQAQVGLLLGTVVRHALEETHPDGLGSDDVRDVLAAAVRDARPWQPEIDPHEILVLLAGALGVHEPDPDGPAPKAEVAARHAALLVAHLVPPGSFAGRLEGAARELAQNAE
jgi:hypothetical protein